MVLKLTFPCSCASFCIPDPLPGWLTAKHKSLQLCLFTYIVFALLITSFFHINTLSKSVVGLPCTSISSVVLLYPVLLIQAARLPKTKARSMYNILLFQASEYLNLSIFFPQNPQHWRLRSSASQDWKVMMLPSPAGYQP